jgi:hypothetical protein
MPTFNEGTSEELLRKIDKGGCWSTSLAMKRNECKNVVCPVQILAGGGLSRSREKNKKKGGTRES